MAETAVPLRHRRRGIRHRRRHRHLCIPDRRMAITGQSCICPWATGRSRKARHSRQIRIRSSVNSTLFISRNTTGMAVRVRLRLRRRRMVRPPSTTLGRPSPRVRSTPPTEPCHSLKPGMTPIAARRRGTVPISTVNCALASTATSPRFWRPSTQRWCRIRRRAVRRCARRPIGCCAPGPARGSSWSDWKPACRCRDATGLRKGRPAGDCGNSRQLTGYKKGRREALFYCASGDA